MPVAAIYEFDIPAHLVYSEEEKIAKQAVKYRIELLGINPYLKTGKYAAV